MRVTIDLCSLKTSEYVSTMKKINPQIYVDEGALIPLVIFQMKMGICCSSNTGLAEVGSRQFYSQ
jgi:hypothetical protein